MTRCARVIADGDQIVFGPRCRCPVLLPVELKTDVAHRQYSSTRLDEDHLRPLDWIIFEKEVEIGRSARWSASGATIGFPASFDFRRSTTAFS